MDIRDHGGKMSGIEKVEYATFSFSEPTTSYARDYYELDIKKKLAYFKYNMNAFVKTFDNGSIFYLSSSSGVIGAFTDYYVRHVDTTLSFYKYDGSLIVSISVPSPKGSPVQYINGACIYKNMIILLNGGVGAAGTVYFYTLSGVLLSSISATYGSGHYIMLNNYKAPMVLRFDMGTTYKATMVQGRILPYSLTMSTREVSADNLSVLMEFMNLYHSK